MSNLFRRILGRRRRKAFFAEEGFHGDRYLIELVDQACPRCRFFVETGTDQGSTIAFMARKYAGLQCYSCEPDRWAFGEAVRNTSTLKNATIHRATSQEFLEKLVTERPELTNQTGLFWLDAHGYGFEWPLKDEFRFIMSRFPGGYLFVDDFKVPGLDCFGFDSYQEQVCSYEYVADAIPEGTVYKLYYPSYSVRTSSFHPLRGWGLFAFGEAASLHSRYAVEFLPQRWATSPRGTTGDDNKDQ